MTISKSETSVWPKVSVVGWTMIPPKTSLRHPKDNLWLLPYMAKEALQMWLECEDYPELSGWEQNVIARVLIRGSQGTSLVVQWLRPCAPSAGGPGSIPGQGIRSHMPQLQISCGTTKTPGSQINDFFFFKRRSQEGQRRWCGDREEAGKVMRCGAMSQVMRTASGGWERQRNRVSAGALR